MIDLLKNIYSPWEFLEQNIWVNPTYSPRKHTVESYQRQKRNAIKRRNIRKNHSR